MMEKVPPRPIEALLTLTSSRKLKLMIVSLVLLCSFLLTAINYIASTYGFASKKQKQETTEDSIIYGHVHVAKTIGTTLLEILAYRYERVCSNKANSILLNQSKKKRWGNAIPFIHLGIIEGITCRDWMNVITSVKKVLTYNGLNRIGPNIWSCTFPARILWNY